MEVDSPLHSSEALDLERREATERYDEAANRVEFGTLAEQKDESFYDSRLDAGDDVTKGQIRFPDGRLYGRDEEIRQLTDYWGCIEKQRPGLTNQVIFLSGISGTGKSALIQATVQRLRATNPGFYFMAGKYSASSAKRPFGAIAEALKTFIRQAVRTNSESELARLRKRLIRVGLTLDSEGTNVLASTLISSLPNLLRKDAVTDDRSVSTSGFSTAIGLDINTVTFAFKSLVQALSSEKRPLFFFLDDLQWADDASLMLISGILKDKVQKSFMFIGAYRTNEVNPEHHFFIKMKEIEAARGQNFPTHYMEITNLSPEDVGQFIADSMDRPLAEVEPITDIVYEKTLGNIFFVKQALEELVRRNAIYYDMVFFQWQFRDVDRVKLEKYLSDDVVVMVQNKIKNLPLPLQKTLSIAANTRNVIELPLLQALLAANQFTFSSKELSKMMMHAVREGVMLEIHGSESHSASSEFSVMYKFAHDRIQEAAILRVPKGEEHNQMLLRISQTLLELESGEDDDWMSFVAVNHMNSLPKELVDFVELARLNLRVGKLANSKAAFSQAAVLFREGVERLDRETCWDQHYQLSLELFNSLMEVERNIGNDPAAMFLAREILSRTVTLPDKCRAHVVEIELTAELNNKDYIASSVKGIKILKEHGINVPLNASQKTVSREKFLLRWAQWFRPLHRIIARCPISEEATFATQLKLMQTTCQAAHFAKNQNLSALLALRTLRLVVRRKMITREVPYIAVFLVAPLRRDEKYSEALAMANVAGVVLDRFVLVNDAEFLRGKLAMHADVLLLRKTFREAISSFLELQKLLIAGGVSEAGLAAGMLAGLCFFSASVPMNMIIEPKLLQWEELASNLGKETYRNIFRLQRQLLHNLQGKCVNPTSMQGTVFDDEQVLSALEGNAQRMNMRDISIFRLMLACIFDDEEVMGAMLHVLDSYPVDDVPIVRQHLRMSWTALAAWTLYGRGQKTHEKWTNTTYSFFQKLTKAGSPNAQPIFFCLQALKERSRVAFDAAIHTCLEHHLLSVAGFMSERYAEVLPEGEEKIEHLKNSYWIYQDWGAAGKTTQMFERHNFLRTASRDTYSSFVRNTSLMLTPSEAQSSVASN